MRRQQAVQILTEHLAELRSFGVVGVELIGSVARGQARPDSDVDLLVELRPGVGLREFMGLKFRLEQLLACPVDLVTRASLSAEQRAAGEHDMVHVA